MIPTLFVLLAAAFAQENPCSSPCIDYCGSPAELMNLEAQATKGALPESDQRCLESSFAVCETMTTKDKISRVLLVNAYAYDTKVWAKLVQRHLDEVDRSDPNIAFLYAYYLHNNGLTDAEGVIRWTEVGLDRKQDWTGDTYVSRVYSLLKLRATAAGSIWSDLERQVAEKPGDDAVRASLERQRNRTKTFAREWLDFARVSGKDVTEAEELCISAGSAKSCVTEGPR